MEFTSIESVDEYLNQIPKFGSVGKSAANFKLSRFRNFCDSLGNPHNDFPAIHVAGTNGKGSTCRLLGTVLQKSGYKVGVYTSPHILNFNERFSINGQVIPDDELIRFFSEYSNQVEQHKLTYFEISTAIAFWWFAKSKVDIAIIEVGLGGRLDATNIIDPLVSVITSISLDHTDILGDRIEDIAREKGGIIKTGGPVVIGDLPEKARDEIIRLAEQKGCKVTTIDELHPQYTEPGSYQLSINGEEVLLRTNLAAPVQAKNLAIAWRVLEQLDKPFVVTFQQFVEAVSQVDLGFGRFNKLLDDQRWYYDGGHNLEAVRAMKQSVRAVGDIGEATLVLSLMKDKIRAEVMEEFSEFKNIHYYQLNLERAATFDDIILWLPQVHPIPCSRSHQSFLNDFDSELVIFAGSFYFYSTVRDWVTTFALNH